MSKIGEKIKIVTPITEMMKKHLLKVMSPRKIYLILSYCFLCLLGCKKSQPIPVSEIIKKIWIVESVEENNLLVYTKGGVNNKRDYSNFKLDLIQVPRVTFVEIDGIVFTGQYEIQNEIKLILKNLTPQPTGTNGTLEYEIIAISEEELSLNRVSNSLKTGGAFNKYILHSL